jgi:hypothetical protein
MATFNKFNQFTKDVLDGVHLAAHSYKVVLTNTAPVNTNTILANITQIAASGGYSTGGTATTITNSTSGGVAKMTGTDVVFTATGSMGPFRYAVLYNDTPTSPVDPLIGWWDYGSAITLTTAGDTFTVDFDATNGILTIT